MRKRPDSMHFIIVAIPFLAPASVLYISLDSMTSPLAALSFAIYSPARLISIVHLPVFFGVSFFFAGARRRETTSTPSNISSFSLSAASSSGSFPAGITGCSGTDSG